MIKSSNKKTERKVVVAMSGGVDSSVASALLKKTGYDVVGIFMRFWKEQGLQKWNRCCLPDSEKRARRVALTLGIPFFIVNLEKDFRKQVVDYFLREYKRGLTPNPCVVCNKEIKFGLLFKKALALKADYIATGHYAKIQKAGIGYKLLKAEDKEKDQSYFLWQLKQKQLKRTLFPLGDLTKKEVRNLAKKLKLSVSGIPESQEICFIQSNINDFLKRHLKQRPGSITDNKGNIIGRHQGLAFYTIGQRKGIGLPGGPYFVLRKDLKKNILIVTKDERDLYQKGLIANKLNWISSKESHLPLKIKVKIRYRSKSAPATICKIKDKTYKVNFDCPQKAITPGQSAVFYRGQEVLGGGIIK